MIRGLLACAALAGCNAVYGIHETTQQDGSTIDAPRLFIPPDAGAACPPPPDVSTWTYTALDLPLPIQHPTFLAHDHVVYAANKHLYEVVGTGAPAQLTEVDPGDGSALSSPGAAPTGNVFWFVQTNPISEQVRVAVRGADGHWTTSRASFPSFAQELYPGPVGFYAGTARMVLATGRPTGAAELSSDDGLAWTEVTATSSSTVFAGGLSANGCWLLVGGSPPTVRVRASDGTFGAALPLGVPAGIAATDIALDPTATRMWLVTPSMIYEATAL